MSKSVTLLLDGDLHAWFDANPQASFWWVLVFGAIGLGILANILGLDRRHGGDR